jgi:hypothetical protein
MRVWDLFQIINIQVCTSWLYQKKEEIPVGIWNSISCAAEEELIS